MSECDDGCGQMAEITYPDSHPKGWIVIYGVPGTSFLDFKTPECATRWFMKNFALISVESVHPEQDGLELSMNKEIRR